MGLDLTYKISDVVNFSGSGGTPSRKNKEYYEKGTIPWLKTKELNDSKIFTTEEKITEEGYKNSSAKRFPVNTVTIAMYGATVGKLGILKQEMATNQACCNIVVDPKKCDYRFLFYYLKYNRKELVSLANGAAQQNLNQSTILNFPFPNIKLEEQVLIADILSSFDDKIENNNAIIANLEEQAQTIFKSWFVDFEPFQEEEYQESELGKIPKKWQVSSLDKMAIYKNGLAMQKYRPESEDDSLPVLKIKELRANRTNSDSDRCTKEIPSDILVENGDIIFSWSGSLLVEIWTGGTAGLNQHLFKVTSAKYHKWFYYYWTKYFLNQFIAIARDRATTMGHIKRSHLKEAKILIPDEETLQKMNKIMDPIVSNLVNLGIQNKKLEETRDILLPKLMSGEIRVEEAIEVEEM